MSIPLPENKLRSIQAAVARILPKFTEEDESLGLKKLHDVVIPLLATAEVVNLPPSHRAAACNVLCAIIETCQGSEAEYARNAVLSDSIWSRLFEIYLRRSENAKPKSMRQVLVVLTQVLIQAEGQESIRQRNRAVSMFLDIICNRGDRMQAKPALQGLAHFLFKDLVSFPKLVEIFRAHRLEQVSGTDTRSVQLLLSVFFLWVVRDDTAQAAGHLIKNSITQIRAIQFPTKDINISRGDASISPLWIEPLVAALRSWPNRMQEIKSNILPHCFLPSVEEYLRFLSYLHLDRHLSVKGDLPASLRIFSSTDNRLETSEEFAMLLAAIETGKELGIVKDVDCRLSKIIEVHQNYIQLPDDSFGGWLSHPTPKVRLAGLYLSVHSTAVSRPITSGIFKSLKGNLPHLHADTDANFRGEVLTLVQRLFDRLRASTATLAKLKLIRKGDRLPAPSGYKKANVGADTGSKQSILTEHFGFITWYLHFLEWELRPGASYQRHITALKAMIVVIKSGLDPGVPHHSLSKQAQGELRWIHGIQISTDRLRRSLLDLMLDAFDDVRSAAASLMQLCLESDHPDIRQATSIANAQFIERAESMMLRTGRADQADGIARAYSLVFSQCLEDGETESSSNTGYSRTKGTVFRHLVYQLEDTIHIAQEDLVVAVNGRPVHGIFAALRYIIDQDGFYAVSQSSTVQFDLWRKLHLRIYTCFATLWSCTRHILCADAPEGYVPEDLEEEENTNTKEVLSYCWRGLKEASVLIRTMALKAPVGNSESTILTPETFERLGRLCFTQLAELRHRGAFSTVAQTFAVFCRRCVALDNEKLRSLPEEWYCESMSCIKDKAESITRRSAGIPSMMAGIIAAGPASGGSLLPRAMKDLMQEASMSAQSSNIEESRLPQVHALNCLKDIFTTSRLSVASEAYIGVGLDLASNTLNSEIWPIRNCGLMLFKALMERLLGSGEAQDWKESEQASSSRFSFVNYPNLAGILSNMLNNGHVSMSTAEPGAKGSPLDLHGAEGVFPALQILRQAPPPEAERASIVKSVLRLTGSPHWHLRDMAARTYVGLHKPDEYYPQIQTLLWRVEGPNNTQHGLLLCVKYMTKKLLGTSDEVNHIPELVKLLAEYSHKFDCSNCPFVKAAFRDLVNISEASNSREDILGPTSQGHEDMDAAPLSSTS
ncbi:putative death-receptor fusion protein-domain-containing protein [Clohesyomyces aquaticus]|uniref:Putative death-receptor fusion protein-domain-containing protein n=1 Tax=Clohesyomyces aquaticus TaxID=1231657 RepID=A0A1Y1ZKN2_9PLEO|nr:putative death-receptor fusion protein-domain-containing protein [Clohesyomyces aquaticus]